MWCDRGDVSDLDTLVETDPHPNGRRWRVVLIDDQPLWRSGVTRLLTSARRFEVIAEVSDPACGLRTVVTERPDVVVTDVDVDGVDCTDTIRQMLDQHRTLLVAVVTACDDPDRVLLAIEAGVSAYLLKTADPEELLAGIRAACRGGLPLSPTLTRQVLARSRPNISPVSPREQEVLRLIAAGQLNKQIARTLGISEKTVKTHVTHVFQRIGVTDRASAAAWAKRHGVSDES